MFRNYKKTLFILIGIQGSTKSSFAHKYLSSYKYISLDQLNTRNKTELLDRFDMDLDSIPRWQLYGSAVYWQETVKKGLNPVSNQSEMGMRSKLVANYDLPTGEAYRKMIAQLLK